MKALSTLTLALGLMMAQGQSLRADRSATVDLANGAERVIALNVSPGHVYSVTAAAVDPMTLGGGHKLGFIASPSVFNVDPAGFVAPSAAVVAQLLDSKGNEVVKKALWWGDPSISAPFAPTGATYALRLLGVETKGARFNVRLSRLTATPEDLYRFEHEPNDDWRSANPMRLGLTVYGSSDDIEYLYNVEEGKTGWDWFKFDFDGPEKLAYFEVDLLDRDVICTLKLYRANGQGEIEEYREGADPTEIRHDDQGDNLLAFKFITRVLKPGSYRLAVRSNHPSYELRTALYDPPPYTGQDLPEAGRKSVRLAVRYLMDGGDSFFHNTPRKGGIRVRAENQTDETERCLTCHPGHFTTFATLSAIQQGYRPENRPQFKWMMDKVYNSMAPFYGHPDAYWTRFDLAPTNGVSRVGHMIALYERYLSGRRTDAPTKAAGFPALVYDARDRLPQDGHDGNKNKNFEFDGNRPISDFRVAMDSWVSMTEAYRRTGDRKWQERAQHLASLIRTGRLKDTEDYVEQAKWAIYLSDPSHGYVDHKSGIWDDLIRENLKVILSRRQSDGGWLTAEYLSNEHYTDAPRQAAKVKPDDPSLTFMTAEAIYVIAAAKKHLGEIKQPGDVLDDASIRAAVERIIQQMNRYGAWLDQKGELFFTPYLETKWAVVMLSYLFPETLARVETPRAPKETMALIDWLDGLWGPQADPVLGSVSRSIGHLNPYVRRKAIEAVGKMFCDAPDAEPAKRFVRPLVQALSDNDKATSLAAAWSLRQLANIGVGLPEIEAALSSKSAVERRGAARVFQRFFYRLTDQKEIAEQFCKLADDPDPMVQIAALQTLWRWWYRTSDVALKRNMQQAIVRASSRSEPLVRLNVAQAVHNILDENTVQFHDNWLRVIARQEDKEIARQARLTNVERTLALDLASGLGANDASAHETLTMAFTYHFLRGGVGNDYDFLTFYDPEAARTLAEALLPLLDSPSATARYGATRAAMAVRTAKSDRLVAKLLERLRDSDANVRSSALASLQHGAFPTDYTNDRAATGAQN
ncbi:MAG: hypothetical protein HUU60_00705 [Armatimonadetes bacterium]|nr:hypothetical protein [Armatimonadota bacterium]